MVVFVVSICARTSDAFFSYSSQNSQISSFIYAHKQTHKKRETEVKEVKKGENIMCTVDKVRRTSAFIIVFVVVCFCAERSQLSQ